jgi:hypothetical protein
MYSIICDEHPHIESLPGQCPECLKEKKERRNRAKRNKSNNHNNHNNHNKSNNHFLGPDGRPKVGMGLSRLSRLDKVSWEARQQSGEES